MLSSIPVPSSSVLAWLMNSDLASGATSESKVMTLMPWAWAFFSSAAAPLRSLPEMAMTSTFWEISCWTNGIWAAPVASLGEV
ncbi:hypothetical protein D9M72_653500 [compost metagenome]